jgi:hypothetical protein
MFRKIYVNLIFPREIKVDIFLMMIIQNVFTQMEPVLQKKELAQI